MPGIKVIAYFEQKQLNVPKQKKNVTEPNLVEMLQLQAEAFSQQNIPISFLKMAWHLPHPNIILTTSYFQNYFVTMVICSSSFLVNERTCFNFSRYFSERYFYFCLQPFIPSTWFTRSRVRSQAILASCSVSFNFRIFAAISFAWTSFDLDIYSF